MIRQFWDRLTGRGGVRALGRPRRGQTTIMFALLAVPMIGMLGLAVDGGVYLYARRTAQTAADAAALAGARQVSQQRAAQGEVAALTTANGTGSLTPSVEDCAYVNKSNNVVGGNCAMTPPADADGVRVRTRTTVPAFFIPVLPGAPRSSIATGMAIARVKTAQRIRPDAPFIVCGYGSWDVTDDPDTNNGGRNRDILKQDNPPMINEEAIGKTFRIWDSRLAQEGAGCDEGSQFKGLANSDENQNRTVPGWIEYLNGTRAGPTRSDVNGPMGCKAGMTEFNGCVLILPLAIAKSGGSGTEIYGVGFAAFKMSPVDANSYNGTLLDAYILDNPGGDDWKPGSTDPITVRLAG
jgi:Flp pilus assembly protein TadG